MKTIIHTTANIEETKSLMILCAINKVSFEFLNGNEFYFTIYDKVDFCEKRDKLGFNIINEKNYIS